MRESGRSGGVEHEEKFSGTWNIKEIRTKTFWKVGWLMTCDLEIWNFVCAITQDDLYTPMLDWMYFSIGGVAFCGLRSMHKIKNIKGGINE